MDVFIYFYERLPCGLDEVEDTLERALGDFGEVTGSGTGEKGSNLDLLISDSGPPLNQVLNLIQDALRPLHLPDSSRIVIESKKYALK